MRFAIVKHENQLFYTWVLILGIGGTITNKGKLSGGWFRWWLLWSASTRFPQCILVKVEGRELHFYVNLIVGFGRGRSRGRRANWFKYGDARRTRRRRYLRIGGSVGRYLLLIVDRARNDQIKWQLFPFLIVVVVRRERLLTEPTLDSLLIVEEKKCTEGEQRQYKEEEYVDADGEEVAVVIGTAIVGVEAIKTMTIALIVAITVMIAVVGTGLV